MQLKPRLLDTAWRAWAEWNVFPLRWQLRHCGRRVMIKRPHFIKNPGQISIGDRTTIGPYASLQCWDGGRGTITLGQGCEVREFAMIMSYGGDIRIGDYCSLNPFAILYGHGGLVIGNNVRIASHSVVIPAQHAFERTDLPITAQGETKKGVVIGNDVWIATGCTILDGVRIGDGAVIGAGAVVTRDVAPYSVVAGIPAREIRKRGAADVE